MTLTHMDSPTRLAWSDTSDHTGHHDHGIRFRAEGEPLALSPRGASGGEIQILDRGAPVARLVPPDTDDDQGARERLIATGLLRPGNGDAAAILDEPPLEVPASLSDALSEERADRV